MDNNTLQSLTNLISLEFFNQSINNSLDSVTFNSQLISRHLGGCFSVDTNVNTHHNVHEAIEINPKLAQSSQYLIGTIKHELCHWYIWNHFHKHGHGKLFMHYLRLVGGTRYAPMPKSEQQHPLYVYRCQQCGNTFTRQTPCDTSKFVCSRCKGSLALIKKLTVQQGLQAGYVHLVH